ncbi:hypothetical protein [Acidisoma sp. 7E03]
MAVLAPRSSFVTIWFVLDAVLALFPPVYWLAGAPTPLIAGIPCSIVYFVLLTAFICGSLIAAYVDDEKRGAFGAGVP